MTTLQRRLHLSAYIHESTQKPCFIPQDRVRVVVSEFEENLDKGAFKDPRDYAIANAEGKAREVWLGMVALVVACNGTTCAIMFCIRSNCSRIGSGASANNAQ